MTKQRDSSKAFLTKLLLANVGLSKHSPLGRCLWLRPTDLQRCVFYEVSSEGTNESARADVSAFSQAPYRDAWRTHVQGPVFVFALYYMCFYFISASFRKHCIIISSWSQRRDYFKWLWVIVLERPAGWALGTGESNITVWLLTVSWTKPQQCKKYKNDLQYKIQKVSIYSCRVTFKYYTVS